MMAIFGTILSQAIMAKMVKMALMAVMEWYEMATTMAIIGVYGKRRSLPSDMSADCRRAMYNYQN